MMLNFLHSHLCDFLVDSVRGLDAITGAIMIAPVIASICFYFGEIWKEKLPRFLRVLSNAFMGSPLGFSVQLWFNLQIR